MTEESRQTEPELSDAEVAGLLDELGEITLEQIRGAHSKQPPGEFLRMQETTTTHREQVDQRLFADWTGRQDAAIDCLKKLPKPGQSLHIIAPGTFNGTDIIPAIIRLDGAKCARECYATTLGFSEGNVKLLAAMLDSGQVKRLTIVCSYYFAKASEKIYKQAETELVPRGVRLLNTRCHCKIMLLALDTGRRFTVETSANLRSCISLEQLVISHDRKLYDFHRKWIEHLFKRLANAKETA
ncbi:MAG: hypothetical protein ABSH21_08865 [Verrucomicrobiia bacterium]|jgi:hypothetical protein